MAECERSRDGHDAARNQHLRVKTQVDVGDQHGASNGRESARHDLVDLGLGQVRNERLDQHSTLALSDERGGGCNDCLSAGDAHAPEEEDGELSDEPLDDTPVVKHLHEGDEEDDSGNDAGDKPRVVGNVLVGQEDDTVAGETEQLTRQCGDEGEDVVANARSENEECDDELDELVKSV